MYVSEGILRQVKMLSLCVDFGQPMFFLPFVLIKSIPVVGSTAAVPSFTLLSCSSVCECTLVYSLSCGGERWDRGRKTRSSVFRHADLRCL